MNKSELVNWLQEEHRQWESLLEQVDPSRMDQPGVNSRWSFNDLLAHLVPDTLRLVADLQAIQRHESAPPPPWPAHLQTDDEINAWIYESNHDRPVSEMLDIARQMFHQFFTVIENLPEDVRIEEVQHEGKMFYLVWLGEQRFQVGEIFDHFHDDHEADIRAWLAGLESQ